MSRTTRGRARRIAAAAGLGLCLALSATTAVAQDAAPNPAANPQPQVQAAPQDEQIGRGSILKLVQQANPMLWPMLACSVVLVGYVIERGLALRRSRVMPREFGRRFMERLTQGKLDRERAIELCKANDSLMARVFGHAVRYWGQPAATIRQGLDHDAAADVLDLKRNVRVLNGVATVAPLLGLLGTVVGMVESFEAVGSDRTGGASRSEALAHGISLALLATAFGLAMAIIAVVFYYYYQQRIDGLVRDLDEQARQVIDVICLESQRGGGLRAPLVPPPHDLMPDPGPTRPAPRTLGRVDSG